MGKLEMRQRVLELLSSEILRVVLSLALLVASALLVVRCNFLFLFDFTIELTHLIRKGYLCVRYLILCCHQ